MNRPYKGRLFNMKAQKLQKLSDQKLKEDHLSIHYGTLEQLDLIKSGNMSKISQLHPQLHKALMKVKNGKKTRHTYVIKDMKKALSYLSNPSHFKDGQPKTWSDGVRQGKQSFITLLQLRQEVERIYQITCNDGVSFDVNHFKGKFFKIVEKYPINKREECYVASAYFLTQKEVNYELQKFNRSQI